MIFKKLLEKHNGVVSILGFDKNLVEAVIKEVHTDWAVVEFYPDHFDKSAPSGCYSVPFSIIVIKSVD